MRNIRSLLVLLATALVAGCGSDDARLTVLLKDAPSTQLSQAWVTITDVNLVGANGITRIGPGKPFTVDLLQLGQNKATLVQDAVVPPGSYAELRFVLSAGCIEVGGAYYSASPNTDMPGQCANGAGTLRMPSMGQSGLKVTLDGKALDVAAGSKVLVVDFDVAQSFGVEAGGSGAWVLHPVITGGDITLSGNVLATVALASGVTVPSNVSLKCTVSLTSDGMTLSSSSSITTGVATVQLYPPRGTYTAALACTGATVAGVTQEPANPIDVSPGQASPITFTIGRVTAP